MRDKFSRFSCYTFKMKIFRIFIVTCSLINLLYKKRCQKCLMFWQYQFQNDHQSVSLSLYMYLKQIKAHGPLAFLNYREWNWYDGFFHFYFTAMKPHEIQEKLSLTRLRDRNWYVQPACATSGDGLYEGLTWLTSNHKSWPADHS